MLPSPTLVFTIPSIHDDTVLDCRIYHPLRLNPASLLQISSPWVGKAAIVAHPYAPLGGCYDDPVVDVIATTILKQGYVVGTFNFRGASSSQGKTSWTSKPEQDDYISMIGFMIYYMHHLSVPTLHSRSADISPFPPRPRSSSSTKEPCVSSPLTLLIAGYSYGGLITTCIPPISKASILPLFETPKLGTPHAEIRLRAQSLATQQNEILQSQFIAILSQPSSPSQNRGRSLKIEDHPLGSPTGIPKANRVRMGGEEDLRRASHESYRSRNSSTHDTPEMVRKSVDRMRTMTRSHRFSSRRRNGSESQYTSGESVPMDYSGSTTDVDEENIKPTNPDQMEEVQEIGSDLKIAYLLVSPPQGIIGDLATLWSSKSKSAKKKEDSVTEDEIKFINNPTLTLFCHDDGLISVKKLKSWAEKLASVEGTKFEYKEITGGGHFWHDHNALRSLRQEVKSFVEKI